MKNINSEIRQQIKDAVINSINKSVETGELPSLEITDITIEIPREKGHGDFSTNVAMQITKTPKFLMKVKNMINDVIKLIYFIFKNILLKTCLFY